MPCERGAAASGREKGAGFLKVSRTIYNCVFNILVAVIMSAAMSFALTIINVGIPAGFFGIWMRSYLVAVIVSIPVTFGTIPLVTKMLRGLEIR